MVSLFCFLDFIYNLFLMSSMFSYPRILQFTLNFFLAMNHMYLQKHLDYLPGILMFLLSVRCLLSHDHSFLKLEQRSYHQMM